MLQANGWNCSKIKKLDCLKQEHNYNKNSMLKRVNKIKSYSVMSRGIIADFGFRILCEER